MRVEQSLGFPAACSMELLPFINLPRVVTTILNDVIVDILFSSCRKKFFWKRLFKIITVPFRYLCPLFTKEDECLEIGLK